MASLFVLAVIYIILALLAFRFRDRALFCLLSLWAACQAAMVSAISWKGSFVLAFAPVALLLILVIAGFPAMAPGGKEQGRDRFRAVSLAVLFVSSLFLFLDRHGMETADHAAENGWVKTSHALMLCGVLPSQKSAYALYAETPPGKRPDLLRLFFATRGLWWTKPALDADGSPLSPIDPTAMIAAMVDEQRKLGAAHAMEGDPEYSAMAGYLAASRSPEDRLALWRYLSGGNAMHPEESAVFARMLLKAGADPNLTGPLYRHSGGTISALSRAASRGAAKHVAMLLDAGADPAARDSRGNTALHYAAYSGNAECASLLVKAGAPLNVKGEGERTPLMQVLALRRDKEMLPLAEILLRAGADPRTTDRDGTSALTLIARKTASAGELDRKEAARLLNALDIAISLQDAPGRRSPAAPPRP